MLQPSNLLAIFFKKKTGKEYKIAIEIPKKL